MFNPLQIILLAILVGVWTWHKYNLQIFSYASVVYLGFLTGLIMGDIGTGMGVWMWASQVPFIGVWVLPIILLTTVGANYVEMVINAIPAWLNAGLNVASGMLPALGFAILLRQMPLKKYGYFLLAGFVMAAYLGMGMLAIAMVGVVICMFIFQLKEESSKQASVNAAQGGELEDE